VRSASPDDPGGVHQPAWPLPIPAEAFFYPLPRHYVCPPRLAALVTGDFGRELQEPTDRPKGKRRSPTSWRRAPGLDGLP